MMKNLDYELECPGCHRRYKRVDIKADRLVCPACGREVVALVCVGEIDSERIIRDYFYPQGFDGNKICYMVIGGLELLGLIYCVAVEFCWSLFVVMLFFGLGILFEIKSNLMRSKIFRIFERNEFDLEKSLEDHRKYIESLGDMAIIDSEIGEDLERNLRARFKAGGKVCTSYAVNSERVQMFEKKSSDMSCDMPPNECPNCHAPYKIADYSGNSVKCRRCGGVVKIKNAVDDAEILDLAKKYLLRLVEADSAYHKLICRFCWVCFILSAVFLLFSDSLDSFLRSWAILPLYIGIPMRLTLVMTDGDRKRRRDLLVSDNFKLFDFEYLLKKDVVMDNERREFDEFKGALLNLFRSKGTAMKGKTLS